MNCVNCQSKFLDFLFYPFFFEFWRLPLQQNKKASDIFINVF